MDKDMSKDMGTDMGSGMGTDMGIGMGTDMGTGKKVLVFGSYVTDLCGRADKFPVAGETVKGRSFKLGPGGKGSNQAVAALRAGADVTFVTKLGDDPLGKQALEFYESERMDTSRIFIEEGGQTGAALIVVNERDACNQIVVISGACERITEGEAAKVAGSLDRYGILLMQLETNFEPVRKLLVEAKSKGLLTVLNPAPAQRFGDEYFKYADILTPNETEAQFFTGVEVADAETARRAAEILIGYGAKKVAVTMGKNGCYACDGATGRHFGIVDCGEAVDSTGAGDAFSGGLVAALARGYGFFDAVAYGSCVAGLAVTRHGTAPAMPYRGEIDKVYKSAFV